jgi:APA family basic amino acid/polyamine antiporter
MAVTRASASGGLGLWSATAFVVGHTVAVGIFLTPAEIIGALASPALTIGVWTICGLLVLAGALTFGELAARFPQAGGPYIYLREGWGERAAFLYGWQSALILDPGITAALAAGLSQYVSVIWPSAAGAEREVAVAVIWILAAIAMSGLRLSARTLGALTALKVLVIGGLGVLAFTIGAGSASHFVPFVGAREGAPPLVGALAGALVGTFFSFGGFWEASRIAGEIDRPERTLPRALAVGVVSVTLLYLITTCAFIYLVPAGAVTSAPEFARRAGEALLGNRGPSVFAAIVVLSVAVSMLALLVMAPRVYVAMSDDGLFPRMLGSLNQATKTPVKATALTASLASLLVVLGTFQQIVAFFICTGFGFIALAAAAVFVVRRRAPLGPFRVPGYPFTPALFILLMVAVLILVAINSPLQAGAGIALLLLGLPAHRFFVSRVARPESVSGGVHQ